MVFINKSSVCDFFLHVCCTNNIVTFLPLSDKNYGGKNEKICGKHSVIFNNKLENIELKHTAFSRELFADVALNAAVWISKKNKGLFSMQDMFGLK